MSPDPMQPLTHPDSVMVPDVSDPGICGKIGADVCASTCPAATMNMKTVSDVFMADLLEPVQLRPEVKAGLSQRLLKARHIASVRLATLYSQHVPSRFRQAQASATPSVVC